MIFESMNSWERDLNWSTFSAMLEGQFSQFAQVLRLVVKPVTSHPSEKSKILYEFTRPVGEHALLKKWTLNFCWEQYEFVMIVQTSSHALGTEMSYFMQGIIKSLDLILLDKIQQELVIDPLTGVGNIKKLKMDLTLLLEVKKLPFQVIFLDIDRLKSINDQYGHLTGSSLIQRLASFLKKQLDPRVLIYRYGGDEFVLIVPHLNEQAAASMMLELQQRLESSTMMIISRKPLSLKTSWGMATFPLHGHRVEEILQMADQMMYVSKKQRKNRKIAVAS